MRSPIAMISYSWKDDQAAEFLHDELVLRGFKVVHDRYSFVHGSLIHSNMADGVDHCDVFVAYLTRSSLYLDELGDHPRPAVTGELIPAIQKRRERAGSNRRGRPILILLAHGLGDRAAASEIVRRRTGERIDAFWSSWLRQDTPHITQLEAASAAEAALRALLHEDPPEAPHNLVVATRGSLPPGERLTVDGTRLFGGDRRPGDPRDWARFIAAIQAVRTLLEAAGGRGQIRIDPRCHLSAALAVGRTFHQATGWRPLFVTRHGDVSPAMEPDDQGLEGGLDAYGGPGDLVVDIDLLGHDVATRAAEVAMSLPPSSGRLSLRVRPDQDLAPARIAGLARASAARILAALVQVRPTRLHLIMSAPAAYAGLLGYHLTAMAAEIVAYEPDGLQYVPAIRLPATLP